MRLRFTREQLDFYTSFVGFVGTMVFLAATFDYFPPKLGAFILAACDMTCWFLTNKEPYRGSLAPNPSGRTPSQISYLLGDSG